jgi:hypothetical protein
MKQTLTKACRSKSAFTLVEVMIASSIAVMLGLLVFMMTVSVGRLNHTSMAKLQINKDVRKFSDDLTRDARSARDYRVFDSTTTLVSQGSGETGDVLVLVWADPEPLDEASAGEVRKYYYRRFIIFARIPENEEENIGPVWRYERNFPAPGSGQTPSEAAENRIAEITAEILGDADAARRQVIQLSRGLATENLFFNSRLGRSITVNGEIYHGNAARRVTNTYNFTVAPRG